MRASQDLGVRLRLILEVKRTGSQERGGRVLRRLDRVVIPALAAFRPDLVLVACGFDANLVDPMGRMLLHSESCRSLTRSMLDAVDGRLVMVHEGGYSEFYLPFCGLAALEELAGTRTEVVDPAADASVGSGLRWARTGRVRRGV